MTSKELLILLINTALGDEKSKRLFNENYGYIVTKLTNDLEVLEILKKYLYIGGDSICKCIKLKWNGIDSISNKEDYEKVKKFLEE